MWVFVHFRPSKTTLSFQSVCRNGSSNSHLLCHAVDSWTSTPPDLDWLCQSLEVYKKGCRASVYYFMLLKGSVEIFEAIFDRTSKTWLNPKWQFLPVSGFFQWLRVGEGLPEKEVEVQTVAKYFSSHKQRSRSPRVSLESTPVTASRHESRLRSCQTPQHAKHRPYISYTDSSHEMCNRFLQVFIDQLAAARTLVPHLTSLSLSPVQRY